MAAQHRLEILFNLKMEMQNYTLQPVGDVCTSRGSRISPHYYTTIKCHSHDGGLFHRDLVFGTRWKYRIMAIREGPFENERAQLK